jgi:hypothetical protein
MIALVRNLRLAVRVLLGTKTSTLLVLLSLAVGRGRHRQKSDRFIMRFSR